MRKTIRDYISEREDLRQTLLSQQGGIVKYLAEHLDADGIEALFVGYQQQCVNVFHEADKWNSNYIVRTKDQTERAALGYDHLLKEVRRQKKLEPLLDQLEPDVAEEIRDFTDKYLTYAYEQNRHRWLPNGQTPREFYRELVEVNMVTVPMFTRTYCRCSPRRSSPMTPGLLLDIQISF